MRTPISGLKGIWILLIEGPELLNLKVCNQAIKHDLNFYQQHFYVIQTKSTLVHTFGVNCFLKIITCGNVTNSLVCTQLH